MLRDDWGNPLDDEAELADRADCLARGRCPDSGLTLHRDGEAGPHAASCDMCDCFGYNPTTVKVHPVPLRLARWKVTRKTCSRCGKGFGDSTGSSICHACLEAAFPLPSLSEGPF